MVENVETIFGGLLIFTKYFELAKSEKCVMAVGSIYSLPFSTQSSGHILMKENMQS